jgi:hypothetical protein
MKHGAAAYRDGRCRCQICADDHRDRAWRENQVRRERLEAGTAPPFRHGFGGYSNWGCRCDVCTKANAAHSREQRTNQQAAS